MFIIIMPFLFSSYCLQYGLPKATAWDQSNGLYANQYFDLKLWKKYKALAYLNTYVPLWDPESIKCSHILEQCPRDWETIMRQNVVLTVFHTQNICHHAWKTLRTTHWCFVFLQSRGEGLKSKENYVKIRPYFPSFLNLLPGIGKNRTSMCCSESFPRMVTYMCGK